METITQFQSHNGAIAAADNSRSFVSSGKVSIPQWCDCCRSKVSRSTRAGVVSIPQWCDCCSAQLHRIFLLKFVSIPQWCDCCLLAANYHFRPNQVSIPQWCDCCNVGQPCNCDSSCLFQSHNGAIAAALERIRQFAQQLFQSHNGAIAADSSIANRTTGRGFNPTMVRLLRKTQYVRPTGNMVSIPQWCDCCGARQ